MYITIYLKEIICILLFQVPTADCPFIYKCVENRGGVSLSINVVLSNSKQRKLNVLNINNVLEMSTHTMNEFLYHLKWIYKDTEITSDLDGGYV